MAILSKACKPDNFESQNSQKVSFINIRGLHSNFADSESFLESNFPDILALCETNLDDSIDSDNFSVRGYLPIIRKDSSTHMHGLRNHLRDVPWEDVFKLSASGAASEFCEWVQVGIDVYIPHRKYQVKPHSSPWFPAACAAAIVHRNHFFHLYQQNKSSESKVKFRQVSNCCKRVLESVKLPYATKTKGFITSQKLGSCDFWQIANSVLNVGKLLYLLYSTDQRCYLLYLIKQNYLLKTFPRTLILMPLVSLYLFSLLELI